MSKGKDLIRHVRSMRLRRLGYFERMQEERMPKHLRHRYIIGVGKKGKPRKIRLPDVEQDMGVMEIKG